MTMDVKIYVYLIDDEVWGWYVNRDGVLVAVRLGSVRQ